MMLKSVRPLAAAAALALSSLAPAAWAQTSESGRPASLNELHDALRLTPVQEAAWRRYQTALAPDPTATARHRAATAMMAALTTPRRIDLINAEMTADLDSLRRQGEAVKTFYATLTPDQQKVFDRKTAPQTSSDEDAPPRS